MKNMHYEEERGLLFYGNKEQNSMESVWNLFNINDVWHLLCILANSFNGRLHKDFLILNLVLQSNTLMHAPKIKSNEYFYVNVRTHTIKGLSVTHPPSPWIFKSILTPRVLPYFCAHGSENLKVQYLVHSHVIRIRLTSVVINDFGKMHTRCEELYFANG